MILSHDELAASLARHLSNDNRMVYENITAGPAGSVRPDVYTIEKSFKNPNPISYECKVSVADFRSDITKAKWKSYLDFSYGVVFAVPRGLIKKEDLPQHCGLMTLNGNCWHTVRRPVLNPKPIDSNLLLKLLIDGDRLQTSIKEELRPRPAPKWKDLSKLRKKFGRDIAEKVSFLDEYDHMKEELLSLKRQMCHALNIDEDKWSSDLDLKKAVEALSDGSCVTESFIEDLESLKVKINNGINKSIDRVKLKHQRVHSYD